MTITKTLRGALTLLSAALPLSAAGAQGVGIAGKTAGFEKRDGFIPAYVNPATGKLLLEIPRDSMRALLMVTQATGFGSNPIGIDRGSSEGSDVVRFDRDGERVLVVLENWRYRSVSDNKDHQRTVAEAFPNSTIASMPLLAEEGGRLLVDATDMAVRDWTDVIGTMSRARQGSYSLARDRSSVNRAFTKAYPDNTEIDVNLTFATNGQAGGIVSQIAPDGRAFTLREHFTLLRLPDNSYRPRAWDPRIGFFGPSYHDFAQPIQSPLVQRVIGRHKLERTNPNDPRSPIKNPIVYYIDRGIPEPLRTASVQGAKFWEQVFDQAGLKGGFRVELLPEGADPMDARYNVVQWVNRNERGWSVGGSLGDPRTGQIIKGMARMDSHRNRTDYNIYAALMGAEAAAADTHFVLARIRQVTAHEIGHTLGLAHNYIASTYERGSVMDYPPPRVKLNASGQIDISAAYALGPGAYDVWAIHWGYGIFPAASEQDSLKAIAADGLKKGYLYLSDGDARPEYSSDPRTNLWDDASTASEFLKNQMDVRRVAMSRFGLRNIRAGEPVAMLQERFASLYFFHRFALNSLSKTIGGMEYTNPVAGDGQQATKPIGRPQQMTALRQLARALRPEELAIPDTILTLMVPNAGAVSPSVELFGSRTRPSFDELGAARTLANMILDMVLQRDRAARLVQFANRAGEQMTLVTVIDTLIRSTWDTPMGPDPKMAALQHVTQRAVAERLMLLAADSLATPEVRGIVDYRLNALRLQAKTRATQSAPVEDMAFWTALGRDLERWLDNRELPPLSVPSIAPPGDPFGIPDDIP